MPKLKTRKSIVERFRLTGKGKVRMSHSNRRHLLTARDRKRKRQLRRPGQLGPGDEERILRLLPYA